MNKAYKENGRGEKVVRKFIKGVKAKQKLEGQMKDIQIRVSLI